MKYRDKVREAVHAFQETGITPLFPDLNYSTENKSEAEICEDRKRLALNFYAAIDTADKMYFITPKGYMGTSMKLELGYALAKNKPIYFSEPTNDISLDCYVEEFIPTGNLQRFLEI